MEILQYTKSARYYKLMALDESSDSRCNSPPDPSAIACRVHQLDLCIKYSKSLFLLFPNRHVIDMLD